MKSLLRRFMPLPISTYLIAFFSVSLLLFALIGGWMLLQMDKVTSTAAATRQQSADQEMRKAVERVLAASQTVLEAIAVWDETYQQLQDNTYYEYWRNARATRTPRTPQFVVAVDLYAEDGTILLPHPTTLMPAAVPQLRHYVYINGNNEPFLYAFMPVTKKQSQQDRIGYVGLRIDFNQALTELNHFIHTDSESIGFNTSGEEPLSTNEILMRLDYTPRDSGETSELESVMLHTLYGFALLAVVLITLSYFLTSSLLHAPLRALAQYIEDLRRSQDVPKSTRLCKGSLCVKEFETLRASITNYQHELEEMHSHLDQKNRELWRLAHHDALTGIANRRAYDEDWIRLQELVRGQRITVSVMLIDCDHFKAINDTYGHDVGDQVIRTIANGLKKSLREGDHLYRLGGDEFAVHLVNTDTEQCRMLAQRCQDQLNQYDFKALGIKEPVRFSIGIATADGSQPRQLAQLHKQADIAMYQAKRPGSNKIAVYYDEMANNGESLLSNRFITAVYEAIENGRGIDLHYQPVLSTDSSQNGFYEILVRLHDERGIIMPINFFPVVESEGLAVEFDYAIFRRIATALEQGTIPANTCVSLNVDGSTLMHHDFIQQISRLKQFIQPDCRSIVLEITENALISELEEGNRKLRHLREAGFTIALDDFGSGYSSLRYLANMPVDIIKFDIGMVRDLEGDSSQRIITEHVAHMVRSAGYQLVAEGVESEALLQRIVELGFTHTQGFLLDRPLAVIEPKRPLSLEGYQQQPDDKIRLFPGQ